MSFATSNLLRLISITAVLFIHSTSAWEYSFQATHQFFSEDFLSVLLNQWARFSVPVFVILSGFGLSKKYMKSEFTLAGFWGGRALRILLPFVVWTLFLLIIQNRFSWDAGATVGANIAGVGETLFTYFFKRGADYHFYFFIIILECYLVFPLLYKRQSYTLWVGLLLLQIVFTSPSHLLFRELQIARPSFPASFVIYWVFYFYTGILLARREEQIRRVIQSIPKAIVSVILLAAFAGVLAEYLAWSYHYAGSQKATPGWYNHFHRQVVIVYALATVIFFSRFDDVIAAWLTSLTKTGDLVKLLAALSFSFYIFHTWTLRVLKATPLANEVLLFSGMALLSTFGVFYIFNLVLRKPIWLRQIFGMPPEAVRLENTSR